MSRIVVDVAQHELDLLGWSSDVAAEELRLAAAMQLYGLGRLSAGEAAQFAAVPLAVFLDRRAEFNIPPYELPLEEIEAEAELING